MIISIKIFIVDNEYASTTTIIVVDMINIIARISLDISVSDGISKNSSVDLDK